MRILITGGAGFIGGHLAEQFALDGHKVFVLDNFNQFYNHEIKEYNAERGRIAGEHGDGKYELVRADVRDETPVRSLVAEADIVFHHAAQPGVRTSIEQPRKVADINISGTLNVLEAARDSDVERVVVASSSAVYGNPEYLPLTENHPKSPISPYGVSKLATDRYARMYNELYALPTVSLRYFTVYGPRMRPNMAISNFVSRCANGESPVVYGDGTQTRDFTYIDDVVQANASLLATDTADGEAMNIGSSKNIRIQALAELIRDRLAPGLDLEYDKARDAESRHTQADVSKANELIGYEPTMSIRTGVARFIDWYDQNQNWYDPLVRRS